MSGRTAAGSASIANGTNPSARYTVALSGTNAIIHMNVKEIRAPRR
jgi:hypothetical protein